MTTAPTVTALLHSPTLPVSPIHLLLPLTDLERTAVHDLPDFADAPRARRRPGARPHPRHRPGPRPRPGPPRPQLRPVRSLGRLSLPTDTAPHPALRCGAFVI